ncbi:hypothetical protein CONCODRAFT_81467 [Conidiobolus coronatus NRRL 28638]|uniref:NADH dehydrogenase [ubiquinone] iron-sulfur protein 4, mitochondrial n=1 Tax=Conidiobolus coronatus (strain ATCC 28846 / CBS 209.66 / NRRL 28638) TaxID=796925 RepID=A0A137PB63_CONC2|nr:hypothetical protein CONCODRAFT_81467 [Conidiobolus coronatus NRRL 28638]|eukprot:KXN72248.1 hypothetical protein CONCODRAFT_81467 [Conidiobolus coronatus NRRL 28638]
MLRLTNTITPAYTTGATQVPAKRPENEVLQADVVSAAPEELKLRTVRIFRPTRNVMQSGVNATRKWRLDFDILEGSARWENPLMGWASSSDYLQGTRINFKTKEDAILFAEKQGWNYYVQEPKQTKFTKKLYANNYKHSYGPLRIAHTK